MSRRTSGSPEKAAVDDLLDSDRVALVGPILAEVLLGFQRKDQADWVASRLRMAQYVEATWNDWRAAADLGRDLAAKGYKLPLTDLLVAGIAGAVKLGYTRRIPISMLFQNCSVSGPTPEAKLASWLRFS